MYLDEIWNRITSSEGNIEVVFILNAECALVVRPDSHERRFHKFWRRSTSAAFTYRMFVERVVTCVGFHISSALSHTGSYCVRPIIFYDEHININVVLHFNGFSPSGLERLRRTGQDAPFSPVSMRPASANGFFCEVSLK
jgi:hypothetical protein